MINPSRIESIGVNKIGEMCYETSKLEPHIPTGDKNTKL